MLGIAQGGLGKPSHTALLPAELDNQQVEVTGFVTRAALRVLEADTSNSDSEQAAKGTYQQIDLDAKAIRKLDQDPSRPSLLVPKLGMRQRTGSYRLLVVSGMGVAIFAFSVFWLAGLLRVPDTAATIASGVLVGLYVSVTDLGAPVQRAAFACVVYMLARLLYRERNPLDALGVAALAALVMDPKALFDAGFQMTLLAVFTIAGIVVPHYGSNHGSLPKGIAAHRFHELRPASSPKTGASPSWFVRDSDSAGTFVASMDVAIHCDWWAQTSGENGGSHPYFCTDASCACPANGCLFSSRHHISAARQSCRRSHNELHASRRDSNDATQLRRSLVSVHSALRNPRFCCI